MNSLVKVVSSAVDNLKRLTVKFFANGPLDIRESVQAAPFGIDSNPIKDMVAIQAETPERGKNYVIGYLNKEVLSQPGETRLFSVNSSGQLQAWLWLRNDGSIEILGTDDNLMKYAQAASTIKEIQQDIAELKSVISGWVPVPNDGGAALKSAASAWFGSPLVEQIDGAKFDEVKTK